MARTSTAASAQRYRVVVVVDSHPVEGEANSPPVRGLAGSWNIDWCDNAGRWIDWQHVSAVTWTPAN